MSTVLSLRQWPAEARTLLTMVGVSVLSTLAMIVCPMIAQALSLDERTAGIFLGATIHDVAQVVGAGYAMSHQTGDVATFVKLLRVAMLLPVIVVAVLPSRRRAGAAGEAGAGPKPSLLPWFAVAFAVLVLINSPGVLPNAIPAFGNDASRWFLVAAIAGIGMKARLKDLLSVGVRPVALMVGETVFLGVLVRALLNAFGARAQAGSCPEMQRRSPGLSSREAGPHQQCEAWTTTSGDMR